MTDRKLALTAGLAGLAFAVVPVIQRLLVLPVYLEHGHAFLAYFNRLSAMIILPGKVVVYRVWPPLEHYFMTWQLLAASGFNFLIYFFIILLLLLSYRRHRRKHARAATGSPGEPSDLRAVDSARSPERRAFLATAATGTAGLAVFATGTYSVFLEPGWLNVRRLSMPIADLAPALDGLTIAHITDVHHDEWVSLAQVRDVVQVANSLKPDIVALTGDYVTARASLIAPSVGELSRLKPRIGTVSVLGNHDWWTDADETRSQLALAGIDNIDNDRMFVSPDRKLSASAESGSLCLAGVGDLWTHDVDPEKAFDGVPAAMPRLLLSHNPDVAEQGSVAAGEHRIDLMLSGHTHGGQVRLPGLGTPIVPSAYGSKYSHGLVKGPSCPVQISAGVGMALLPVRLNVRPEIVLITLRKA